ncbi:hypothetical protein D5R81_18700 [Parashewanella spongiae]|uniref:Uncharacterized protein n=1 Tax=Parashewanella spongiae TaxID=342950 RepID=A0A3A6TUP4_9GAMM|nr:hypothetical protein [Parashewanella spongiae]MCL1080144.1 hypothetical protein [Parashewanella spongiae]RJY05203.1 hypothetical protein D5R81_18700 [Parashewanella spongiae]
MTLVQAMMLFTVDELKSYYLTYFGKKPSVSRKADIVDALEKGLSDPFLLKTYWDALPEIEQHLVRESIYNYQGVIDRGRFTAKYGYLPSSKRRNSWQVEKLLGYSVFFYKSNVRREHSIPLSLQKQLKQWAMPPEKESITSVVLSEPLDASFRIHHREPRVFTELNLLLTAIQNQKIKVSDKTVSPTAATLKYCSRSLEEYYPSFDFYEVSGEEHILSYGWIKLLANSRFTQKNTTVLTMSSTPAMSNAETIRFIWNDWVFKSVQDEFNRISAIKGQTGKGRRYMTDVSGRRMDIVEGLKACPVGEWVSFDDFSRYLEAIGSDVVVTTAPEYLYACDSHYGRFYDADWNVLAEPYLQCVLLEYAATLGLIDIVLCDLDKTDSSNEQYWGLMDLECFHRYEGVTYFRLTKLGAYVLGESDHYEPETVNLDVTPVTLMPKGRFYFASTPMPWEIQFIGLYCKQKDELLWALDRKLIVEALQSGGSTDELQNFVLKRDPQPFLPQDWETLFKQVNQRIDGATAQFEAMVYCCKNKEVLALILSNKVLTKYCQPLDELQLVIPKNKALSFKNKLNEMGIGCQ